MFLFGLPVSRTPQASRVFQQSKSSQNREAIRSRTSQRIAQGQLYALLEDAGSWHVNEGALF